MLYIMKKLYWMYIFQEKGCINHGHYWQEVIFFKISGIQVPRPIYDWEIIYGLKWLKVLKDSFP